MPPRRPTSSRARRTAPPRRVEHGLTLPPTRSHRLNAARASLAQADAGCVANLGVKPVTTTACAETPACLAAEDPTVRALPRRSCVLGVSHSKSALYGVFVWVTGWVLN